MNVKIFSWVNIGREKPATWLVQVVNLLVTIVCIVLSVLFTHITKYLPSRIHSETHSLAADLFVYYRAHDTSRCHRGVRVGGVFGSSSNRSSAGHALNVYIDREVWQWMVDLFVYVIYGANGRWQRKWSCVIEIRYRGERKRTGRTMTTEVIATGKLLNLHLHDNLPCLWPIPIYPMFPLTSTLTQYLPLQPNLPGVSPHLLKLQPSSGGMF